MSEAPNPGSRRPNFGGVQILDGPKTAQNLDAVGRFTVSSKTKSWNIEAPRTWSGGHPSSCGGFPKSKWPKSWPKHRHLESVERALNRLHCWPRLTWTDFAGQTPLGRLLLPSMYLSSRLSSLNYVMLFAVYWLPFLAFFGFRFCFGAFFFGVLFGVFRLHFRHFFGVISRFIFETP